MDFPNGKIPVQSNKYYPADLFEVFMIEELDLILLIDKLLIFAIYVGTFIQETKHNKQKAKNMVFYELNEKLSLMASCLRNYDGNLGMYFQSQSRQTRFALFTNGNNKSYGKNFISQLIKDHFGDEKQFVWHRQLLRKIISSQIFKISFVQNNSMQLQILNNWYGLKAKNANFAIINRKQQIYIYGNDQIVRK